MLGVNRVKTVVSLVRNTNQTQAMEKVLHRCQVTAEEGWAVVMPGKKR
jgi:hypothetical protein